MGVLEHLKAAGTVEVPHSQHPVVVQPPQVKREEYPFTGFIDFQGLKIDVENKKGDYRRGKDKDGHEWKVLMHNHYGEIRDTEGVDGDNLDVYVGPNHDASTVVVIRQHRPDTGAYDEDKVMVGFDSVEEAIGAYKKQYDKPGFYKEDDYLAMPIGRFWRWVHDTRKHGKKVASLRDHTIFRKRPPVNKKEQAKADTHLGAWLDAGQSYDDPEHPPQDGKKMAAAALPDIVRPTIQPQHWEYALHPALKKALLGLAGGAVAGGAAKKVHDAHQEEKETGLPSKLKRGALYGLGGAALGAGLGLGASKAYSRYLLPSAQMIMKLVKEMRASGVSKEQIGSFLKNTPGVRDHLHAADIGAEATKLKPTLEKALPAVGAAYAGGVGVLSGVGSARRQTEQVTELADALHDNPPPRKGPAREPSDDLFLHPAMTDALRQRAWERHGAQRAGEEKPSWLKHIGAGALEGGLVGGLYGADALLPAALGMRMPTRREMVVPAAVAGAGALLGAGTGALARHFSASDLKEWQRAREKGPAAMSAHAREKADEQREWLSETELTRGQKRQAADNLGRAQTYNAHRTKTAEHVLAPTTPRIVEDALRPVLASLFALYQLYYFAHWSSRGEASYGDHQLFERLYKSTQEEFDSVAERIVGHCGEDALAGVFTLAAQRNEEWMRGNSPLTGALAGEAATQDAILRAYRDLDTQAGLTLGLDDLLMQLASQHETNLYLLRQRTRPQIGAAVNMR